MSDPPAKLQLLDSKKERWSKMTTLNKNEIIEYLVENDFCVTDKICVFCSTLTDGWNRFCPRCKDYKGMTSLYEAVEYYGTEILPN
jgi:hypothetical protein